MGSALAGAGERERRWKGKKNGKEEKVKNGLGKSFACAMLTRYLFL